MENNPKPNGDGDPRKAVVTERDDSRNALGIYLSDIGKFKLITREREVELAKLIKKGSKAAREEMIQANLRLVIKIARDYENAGLPLLDLISEGNIGLMKAVERFDPAKGGKVSTYASWWIKQSIMRALANQSKTIRLPVHVVEKISKMRKVTNRLHEELGREPTDEEVAFELGETREYVTSMQKNSLRPASLEDLLAGPDSQTYAETIVDEKTGTASEIAVQNGNQKMVNELIEKLPKREAYILRQRFGFDGGKEKTLEEVAGCFRITRERVRQIQDIALGKLGRMIGKIETRETSSRKKISKKYFRALPAIAL